MAKGKQALMAARRRVRELEAEVSVLTAELGERKESEAELQRENKQMRALQLEVTRLRQHVADGTSDALIEMEQQRDRHLSNVAKLELAIGKNDKLVELLLGRLSRFEGGVPEALEAILSDDLGKDVCVGVYTHPEKKRGVHLRAVERKARMKARRARDMKTRPR